MNVATVFTIIAGALCVAGFVLLAWMMIAAHLWPRCVLSLESPDESKAAAYATLIVIVIASGVFGYYGAAGLLWMIPESWGGVNDDGVWMSVRNYIAGSAAIVFSVWFHTTMFRFARQSVERDRLAFIAEEQKALIGASQSTLQSKLQQYEDFARGNLPAQVDRLRAERLQAAHSIDTFLELAATVRAALHAAS